MKVCKLPICYIFQLPNKIYSKTSNLHKTEVKCIKYPLPYATSIFILHFFLFFFNMKKNILYREHQMCFMVLYFAVNGMFVKKRPIE